MRIVIEIVVGWVILSCTLGPALTWALFYGKRRARVQRANRVLDESPAHSAQADALEIEAGAKRRLADGRPLWPRYTQYPYLSAKLDRQKGRSS
jgi:hypothetical protein